MDRLLFPHLFLFPFSPFLLYEMSSTIEEIEPQEQPVAEGYVGNLNDEQHDALVQMWQSYFDICDRARGRSLLLDVYILCFSASYPRIPN